MKKLLILLATLTIQITNSQERTEGIFYERNEDHSIDFEYVKSAPGSIFVILKFKNLTNASSNTIKKTISGFGGDLTTLRPQNTSKSIGFSYSYRILNGNADALPQLDFKYILPFKNNKSIKVRNLNYLGKRFGAKAPKNWTSFQFLTTPNDTVCAIRKGIVIHVEDKYESEKSGLEYGYKNKNNYIIIEHEDGTMARYGVLKYNSTIVKVGDTVYPSAALAVAGSYDKKENSQLRLSIFYLDNSVKDLDFNEKSKETLENMTHINAYVNPFFILNPNETIQLEKNKTYTGFCNNEIIEEEMTKRELKKWKKNKELVK